ncbi:ribosome maturation factor RimM [Ventosimonas gracilis]|uniref:Ribosome maturation factor RimM n=1 Tax=Ventosimonas gracilis TaxID=1680762 RepID=A0A139SV11_9GAMM|nr:ribosome maturation factor RimM [Ventosimonas gracilis]KXU38425.1 ribosome maturation factor RimM [Ventosimonas gracilis]
MPPLDQELIVVGKVLSAHGVRGELKVYSFTEPPANLLDYPNWILRDSRRHLEVTLSDSRQQGKNLLVFLDGIDDRDQAQQLAHLEICVRRSELPKLDDGEYYWHQLEGLKVIEQNGRLLGRIERMLSTGANDVMRVLPCEGSLDQRERLLPYTDGCVRRVDLGAGEMQVEWDADF